MFVAGFLIIANMITNGYLSYKEDLKMGLVNVHNYKFLGTIIAKPWVHT